MSSTTNIPKLTEKQIKECVGGKSLEKGKRYFKNDAIYEARRTGITLKASCEGSYNNVYRLWVKFNKSGISEAECSCPVGGGGSCKHIAALLLTWNAHSEEFPEVPDVEKILNSLEKNELIDLIKRMLNFDPQLELMLQISRQDNDNPRIYERQADEVFRRSQIGWRGEIVVVNELPATKNTGDSFIKKRQYSEAAAVYEGVSTSIMKHLNMFPEEEDISPVINECVAGLGECIEHEGNDEVRLKILKVIFAIYRKDMDDFGGIGISDEIPEIIEKYSTKQEQKMVNQWIHDAISVIKDDYHYWSRKEYNNLLEKLEKKGNK